MIRQYRIERFQGVEVLVCECFCKHTWTQSEYEAYMRWRDSDAVLAINASQLDFKSCLNEFLNDPANDGQSFFGLVEPIPVYDNFPCLIIRGAVVDNKVASLQVDYVSSMLPPEILHEISEFYGVLDSRHWRNMVSCQVEKYGSLFASDGD